MVRISREREIFAMYVAQLFHMVNIIEAQVREQQRILRSVYDAINMLNQDVEMHDST